MNESISLRSGGELVLTEEVLKQVEQFGAVQFSPEQLADVMEADREQVNSILTGGIKHPLNIRYHKGRLQSEFKIRAKIFDMAEKNSSQAQELAIRLIEKNKSDLA